MISECLLSCGQLLIAKNKTIAFAESATAGRMAAQFSLIPDAGKFLKGGLICYDASLKTDLLFVAETLIQTCTPESMEVTCAITAGLQSLIKADIHIGVTGLSCPGGSETPTKPVGTFFVCAMDGRNLLFHERMFFKGDPEEICLMVIEETARLLENHLR